MFKDTATSEQLRVREVVWNSVQPFVGKPKTPHLVDSILKACRDALEGKYFVAYHDCSPETDLILLVGGRTESGLYTIDTILMNDVFQTENNG